MKKILFLIPELSGGGAEKVLCNLVNNMDQTQFEITVQTIEPCDAKKYLAEGIRYKSINACRTAIGRKLFSYWFRFCAELNLAYRFFVKDDYDIEVAYLECGATKVMAASNNKKALKLAWVHCDLQKKGVTSQKTKKQYEKFDKVVCVSEDVKKSFSTLFGMEIPTAVIHNVIDEDEVIEKSQNNGLINPKKTTTQLVAIGRLTPQKAFDKLINCCAILKNDGYSFELKILGEGEERDKLENLIKEKQVEDAIELVGFMDNPYSYMRAADCIVCSSNYEGFSTVMLEALILGKPIITTNCTGMLEILGQSQYGMVVDNSIDGLVNGIKRYMDKPELADYYAKMAKQRGLDFYKAKTVRATEMFLMRELRNKTMY